MKKYSLVFVLALGSLICNAQDFDNILTMIKIRQFDKAKPLLDKYMTSEKNAAKAENWYYKAVVYNGLALVDTKPVAERKSLNQEGYDAIKKYMEMEAKAPLTTEEKNTTIYNSYYVFFDLGIKLYNGKQMQESYDMFKSTLEAHDYIYNHNLAGSDGRKFSQHDTDIVWNLVVLGNELKKKDEVMTYYKRIADADLGDERYAEAYDELIKKYRKEDNKEMFNKYLDRAKKHFSSDPYWETVGIEYALRGLENEDLFKKYEELMLAYPNNYMVFFNYGHDLDKYVYSADSKGKDVSAYKKKIPELYKKAISINSTVDANVLLANYYYNSSFDFIDEAQKIKGTKPEDVKKKNELMASSKSALSQAIPSGEEAVKLYGVLKEFKTSDKVNYKQILDILSAAYKQNGNAAKAAEYEKKKEEVDKL
jgi:tetratricopeptide (TPR) repeat protein